jgi:DNA repair protein RecN (Recombination protein N)
MYTRLQEPKERIHSCYLDLKDLAEEMEVMLNDLEVNPERMEQVNERINLLYGLQQKHRVGNTQELIALRDGLAEKMSVIDSFEEELVDLSQKLKESEKQAQNLAEKLSASRNAICQPVEERLVDLLVQLGMPKAILKVKQDRKPMEADGQDRISFLFSANRNATPQPISQIASGGEISRIMLSIKSLIADFTSLPTLIFDEIDTGVSGEIAHKMGQIMQAIAAKRQVVCITHLPQIAAKGDSHFKVFKTEKDDRTVTAMKVLQKEDRLQEIAQMLSGANVSEAAIRNAHALLLENQ